MDAGGVSHRATVGTSIDEELSEDDDLMSECGSFTTVAIADEVLPTESESFKVLAIADEETRSEDSSSTSKTGVFQKRLSSVGFGSPSLVPRTELLSPDDSISQIEHDFVASVPLSSLSAHDVTALRAVELGRYTAALLPCRGAGLEAADENDQADAEVSAAVYRRSLLRQIETWREEGVTTRYLSRSVEKSRHSQEDEEGDDEVGSWRVCTPTTVEALELKTPEKAVEAPSIEGTIAAGTSAVVALTVQLTAAAVRAEAAVTVDEAAVEAEAVVTVEAAALASALASERTVESCSRQTDSLQLASPWCRLLQRPRRSTPRQGAGYSLDKRVMEDSTLASRDRHDVM